MMRREASRCVVNRRTHIHSSVVPHTSQHEGQGHGMGGYRKSGEPLNTDHLPLPDWPKVCHGYDAASLSRVAGVEVQKPPPVRFVSVRSLVGFGRRMCTSRKGPISGVRSANSLTFSWMDPR